MVSYDGQLWNSRPAFSGLHPVTVKEKAKARFQHNSFFARLGMVEETLTEAR